MAKFCETCGKQLEDEAVFCPDCGAQTANTTQSGQQNVQGEVPPVYNQGVPIYGQQGMQEPKNGGIGFSIASMVCGIVSLVFSCCVPWLTFVVALVGVVLGGVSLANKKDGKGMAVAGVVCSIVALIPAIIVLIIGTSAIGLGSLEGLMSGF